MFKRAIDIFSRIFVGGLFIFSGMIKINDPIGTKIKLQEYFEVFSSDFGSFFEIFIPLALPLGMILIVLEVVLGVAVLINFQMPKTTWILLALMVFFTFLTFYSAYFNKVTDCGCFGDAIPLTPWQSFYKDVILIVFVLHLFWYRNTYEPMLLPRTGKAVIFFTGVISTLIGIYAIRHLPYIDFRPYKVDNSIPQEMIPDESPILEYTFKKDGEEVVSDKYLMPDEGYEYVSSRVTNEKAATAKITDYQLISKDGEDFTNYSFEGIKLFLIYYDVSYHDEENLKQLSGLIDNLDQRITPIILTSAGEADIENYRHEYQLAVPYYFVDATVLKAMIRSNPGVMLLQNGFVLGKWHYNDIPDLSEINALVQ
ncbi:MAG: BT_3928 family protein [Bacteroidota bacterium]